MYSSSIQRFGGGSSSPDYLYYNADIVNNTTGDVDENGKAVVEPQIRFNETRDTALIKNVSDYYFSIIRFQMNGSSKDLPLFIPNIREGTGQTNPNLTEYAMACGWTQTFQTTTTFAINGNTSSTKAGVITCATSTALTGLSIGNVVALSGLTGAGAVLNGTFGVITALTSGTSFVFTSNLGTSTPVVAAGAYTGTATLSLTLSALPAARRILFSSDTSNPVLAPIPRGLQSINFQNYYSASIPYAAGSIVQYAAGGYTAATDPLFIYNSYSGPFWTATIPSPQIDTRWTAIPSSFPLSAYSAWNPNRSYINPAPAWSTSGVYAIGAIVSYNGITWKANFANGPEPIGNAPPFPTGIPATPFYWTAEIPSTDNSYIVSYNNGIYYANGTITGGKIPSGQTPSSTSVYWAATDDNQGQSQDLSSRYYWLYTYNSFVQLWNNTMFDVANPNRSAAAGDTSTSAWQDTYNAITTAITAYNTANGLTGPNALSTPWATFGAFCDQYVPPQLIYNVSTGKFSISASNMSFGNLLQTFTPSTATAGTPIILGQAARPQSRLFFNTNLAGLLSNFQNDTWNSPGSSASAAISPYPITTSQPSLSVPNGYAIEILFPNRFYTNVVDYRNAPTSAGSNPAPAGYVPTNYAWVYWIAEQDYTSTDSLWSPISSIVFTTSLIPVKTEATAQPVNLGSGNTGISAATSQSAFQPIITDIAIDTSQGTIGSAAYRQSVYYAPVAEYRLADFAASNQELRNIDIQVFWKGRLDNVLYPIRMYNMSSVNIKILFKKKGVEGKIPNL